MSNHQKIGAQRYYLGRTHLPLDARAGPLPTKAYLLAFVVEIEADYLFDGAKEGEEDVETDPAALLAANDKIRSTYRPRGDIFTVEWQI